ncbi:serrate RNA effector molecule -like protein [Brachionus plicatilis]|uniref:Serrate RNA effector molecule-like protein n=1 Tax=Brachionus plicatilis TaxID=10195 RepID=A0A3M7SVJ8_BRAPC|nr:serrate RNA effector molecule -like protein [Brachionus plicatilis]
MEYDSGPASLHTGYYEHDNRLGMAYDDYDEVGEYFEDYHSVARPTGYPAYPYAAPAMPTNFNAMMMMKPMMGQQAVMPFCGQLRPGETGLMGQYPSASQPVAQIMTEFPTQPRMMTFREFLKTLSDDELKSETESYRLNKYNQYKEEFRAEQTRDFFEKHKNEDWFRLRYHPDDSHKRKLELKQSIGQRLAIFVDTFEKYGQHVTLEMHNDKVKQDLFKFLDACIIRLEGGNDTSDLDVLDKIYTQKQEAKIAQRTQSIFFKHLPVYVTRGDLERIGKRLDGYKRASISEPAPERGFQRRGWITYDSTVDIKDICAKLNGVRVNDTSKFVLNATINRDLDQRIKVISGLSNHCKIVRQDLRTIVRVVQNMDKKWSLYADGPGNGLVDEAVRYLDQVDSEVRQEVKDANELIAMEKDEAAARHLDRLILYLRIVHSIDYYNASEYQQEDYMPYRCGSLHARASSQLKSDTSMVQVIKGSLINAYDPDAVRTTHVNEWLRLFENHIRPYAEYKDQIDVDLAKKLGMKDQHTELEKFIRNNCQKVDKDVWLCPLSGKKFKGPDYVRKHIETKHDDKLKEIKLNVEYFNKFVMDPKRPYLPEHPMNRNMGKMSLQSGFYQMDEFELAYNYTGTGLAGPVPAYPMFNQYAGASYQAPGLGPRSNAYRPRR